VQALVTSPHALTENLRLWLETQPQKVLYGTDSGPADENYTWEETLWVANHRSRAALTAALDAMVADGEITRDEALQIARGVLRENAVKLYNLQQQ
jgi:predicted TIM-barrel fold metal-dependent hydrolase